MNTIFVLLTAGIVLTIGDIFAGKWVESNKKYFYFLTLIFYMIGLNFLIYSYKFEDIAVAAIIMEIFNIVTLTLVGRFLFKENITRTETAGIIVGIIAVIILEIA
jgi:multidrug transporter EmrE-like cation transporter